MAGPLEGLKVLEFIRVPPGAFCTMMLADMGPGIEDAKTPRQSPAGHRSNPQEERSGPPICHQASAVRHNLSNPADRSLLATTARTRNVLSRVPSRCLKATGRRLRTSEACQPASGYCLSGASDSRPVRDRRQRYQFLSIARGPES